MASSRYLGTVRAYLRATLAKGTRRVVVGRSAGRRPIPALRLPLGSALVDIYAVHVLKGSDGLACIVAIDVGSEQEAAATHALFVDMTVLVGQKDVFD